MSRHPDVPARAFVLPPPARDAGFMRDHQAWLRTVYRHHGGRPSTEYSEQSASNFRRQFHLLLLALATFAEQHGVSSHGYRVAAARFQGAPEGFANYYASEPKFYQDVKALLELFAYRLVLLFEAENKKTVKRHLEFVNSQLAVCGPGMFTSLNDVIYEMEGQNCPEAWLADQRDNIIRLHAEAHIAARHISDGNSVHVHIILNKLAHQIGFFTPKTQGLAALEDRFYQVAQMDELALAHYAMRFYSCFSPNEIVNGYSTRLQDLLRGFKKPAAGERTAANKNLMDPQHLKEFNALVAPYIRAGVIRADLDGVVEESDDFTEMYLSDAFVKNIPAMVREYLQREGYLQSTAFRHLKQISDGIERVRDQQGLDEDTRTMLALINHELIQLLFMAENIRDEPIADLCMSHADRAEAALHLVDLLLVVLQSAGSEPQAGLHQALLEKKNCMLNDCPYLDVSRAQVQFDRAKKQQERELHHQHQLQLAAKLQPIAKGMIARARLKKIPKAQAMARGFLLRQKIKRERLAAQAAREAEAATQLQRQFRRYYVASASHRLTRYVEQELAILKEKAGQSSRAKVAYQLCFGHDMKTGQRLLAPLLDGEPLQSHNLVQAYIGVLSAQPKGVYCIDDNHQLHFQRNRLNMAGVRPIIILADSVVWVQDFKLRQADYLMINRSFMLMALAEPDVQSRLLSKWRSKWVNDHNLAALLRLRVRDIAFHTWVDVFDLAARLLTASGRTCLSDLSVQCLRWMMRDVVILINADLKSAYLDWGCAIEEQERFSAFCRLPYHLRSEKTMALLGGLQVYREGLLLDVIQALHPLVLRRDRDTALTAPVPILAMEEKLLKRLLSLRPLSRDYYISEINRRIETGLSVEKATECVLNPAAMMARIFRHAPERTSAELLANHLSALLADQEFQHRIAGFVTKLKRVVDYMKTREPFCLLAGRVEVYLNGLRAPYNIAVFKRLRSYAAALQQAFVQAALPLDGMCAELLTSIQQRMRQLPQDFGLNHSCTELRPYDDEAMPLDSPQRQGQRRSPAMALPDVRLPALRG